MIPIAFTAMLKIKHGKFRTVRDTNRTWDRIQHFPSIRFESRIFQSRVVGQIEYREWYFYYSHSSFKVFRLLFSLKINWVPSKLKDTNTKQFNWDKETWQFAENSFFSFLAVKFWQNNRLLAWQPSFLICN